MTQESALTREEIEAVDEGFSTSSRKPPANQEERDAARELQAVRSQEPEAKS
jgi:hypothetical protein